MHDTVRALLHHIVDYAGLFPPAKLPLDVALRQYLEHKKQSPFAWMLGRFVCPAVRLADLATLAKSHADASLLCVSVLGTPVSDVAHAGDQCKTDMQAIAAFREAWGDQGVIDQYEVVTPTSRGIAPVPGISVFLESPRTPTWRDDVTRLLSEGSSGLKLRSGGAAADAFPAGADIAFFIHRCRAGKRPWKATAGLHHPRRFFDKTLNLWHHGFLNVFGAGVLAFHHPLSEADIASILADRAGDHFRFETDRLAWKSWSCSTQQIADARAHFATSFGSCSFDEPCEDLLAMGLLNRA
ncbi:MAG: hypothetical protein FJ303_16255 [Planctomycetes bacterium]|nr:hypothetical protein [Planctomycetota bacterium]